MEADSDPVPHHRRKREIFSTRFFISCIVITAMYGLLACLAWPYYLAHKLMTDHLTEAKGNPDLTKPHLNFITVPFDRETHAVSTFHLSNFSLATGTLLDELAELMLVEDGKMLQLHNNTTSEPKHIYAIGEDRKWIHIFVYGDSGGHRIDVV
jgi:hypothetical protein